MARVTISKEVQFDTGHRVPNHASKCCNPHGHRYRVVAYCTGELVNESGASDEGMLVDFSDLKEWLTTYIHDVFDHAFVFWKNDALMLAAFEKAFQEGYKVMALNYIPTAENFAKDFYERLKPVIENHWRGNLSLSKIEVWETPTSLAEYGEDVCK